MNLFNSLYRLVGRAEGNYALETDDSLGLHCPDEAEILAYLDGKNSSRVRAELESHFARCCDCCELLALFIKAPDEQIEGFDETLVTLSDDGVKKQAARILAFIENDESRYDKTANEHLSLPKVTKKREGFYVPYPALASLALILCAVAAWSAFYLIRDHRPQAGMDALRLAMKDERRTPVRISGGLPHSPYALTRGGEDSDGLQFERAMNKLKYAEDASVDPEARLALARVHLALGKRDEAKKALTILKQLVAGGNHSAEVLNDLGVAQFQLGNYDEAISNFVKAVEKSPTFNEALFNRALAEEHDGRVEEARQDWEQFIELTSDGKWKAEAQWYLNGL